MSETSETQVPEDFQKAAAEWESGTKSLETQGDPEAIKKAKEIKDSIIRSIGDKWTPTNGGREYRGFLTDPKYHVSIVQKFNTDGDNLRTLEIHLNQYKPGQRMSTTVLFLNKDQGSVNWYGFEAERNIVDEARGETDTVKSLFWANYKDDALIGHQETNSQEGLQFATEIRDALIGKVPTQKPAKFTRRRLLGLK